MALIIYIKWKDVGTRFRMMLVSICSPSTPQPDEHSNKWSAIQITEEQEPDN